MRFVMSHRRSGKFRETDKRASREAMSLALSGLAPAIDIAADHVPVDELARKVTVFDADPEEVRTMAATFDDDVLVEPELLHYCAPAVPFRLFGSESARRFALGDGSRLRMRVQGAGAPLRHAEVHVTFGAGPHPDPVHTNLAGAYIGGMQLPPQDTADVDSHGTHVCGTIAARPDRPGAYGGLAPGATLFAARVFRDAASGAKQGDIANAIDELSRTHLVSSLPCSARTPPTRCCRATRPGPSGRDRSCVVPCATSVCRRRIRVEACRGRDDRGRGLPGAEADHDGTAIRNRGQARTARQRAGRLAERGAHLRRCASRRRQRPACRGRSRARRPVCLADGTRRVGVHRAGDSA
jgi:hypothetical protein